MVKADLLDPSTLRSALEGAHGAFVVTNFWDPAQMQRETEIGMATVQAASAAGIKHLVWSTLPDSEKLTGGEFQVRHRLDQRCVLDSQSITFTPACDSAVAIPNPMPEAAPVTNAVLPAISIIRLFPNLSPSHSTA